jgi:hypothetical protein
LCHVLILPPLAQLTGVADATREALAVLPSREAQLSFSRLYRQEWPYYRKANAQRLPALPPGADDAAGGDTSGLSNATYLNFVLYVQFKVLAKALVGTSARDAFSAALGERLLAAAAPGALATATARSSAGAGVDGDDGDAALRAGIRELLDAFVTGGYMRSYVLAWGAAPGLPDAPGFVPDAEDDAAATMQARQDGSDGAGGDAGDVASGAQGARVRRFQVRLIAPADIEGGVALRAEEEGFWAALVPSALAALLRASGRAASVDETYFQDAWQSPASLRDRVLLALGDPFFEVEVPFVPDTLVLDCTFLQDGSGSGAGGAAAG